MSKKNELIIYSIHTVTSQINWFAVWSRAHTPPFYGKSCISISWFALTKGKTTCQMWKEVQSRIREFLSNFHVSCSKKERKVDSITSHLLSLNKTLDVRIMNREREFYTFTIILKSNQDSQKSIIPNRKRTR